MFCLTFTVFLRSLKEYLFFEEKIVKNFPFVSKMVLFNKKLFFVSSKVLSRFYLYCSKMFLLRLSTKHILHCVDYIPRIDSKFWYKFLILPDKHWCWGEGGRGWILTLMNKPNHAHFKNLINKSNLTFFLPIFIG